MKKIMPRQSDVQSLGSRRAAFGLRCQLLPRTSCQGLARGKLIQSPSDHAHVVLADIAIQMARLLF